MIPEWSEKSYLYMALSPFPSRQLKKFFVRGPSLISQRSGKTNRILFQSMVLAKCGITAAATYKWTTCGMVTFMLNIIPLPFESSLSASYTDASELVQAMQRLEHHLAHVVNIWVMCKWFDSLQLAFVLTTGFS